jgi:hypothetical protein
MEYTISEASRKLNVTRVTIYKKLEKIEGIQQYIQNRGKTKYISDVGLELIKKSILESCKVYTIQSIQDVNMYTSDKDNIDINASNNKDFSMYTDIQQSIHVEYINSLKSQIEGLNRQLESKDKHIDAQNDHIQSLAKLNENNQILLSQAQQKILLGVLRPNPRIF